MGQSRRKTFLFCVLVIIIPTKSRDIMSETHSTSQALVVFSNANPYAQAFSLHIRPFVIGENTRYFNQHSIGTRLNICERISISGGKSFSLRQAWEERIESEPEPTGLKWTGAAVWDAAVVLSAYIHANAGLIQVLGLTCTRSWREFRCFRFQGRRCVEVGAGLGLVSIAAGAFGPSPIQ